MEPIFANDRDRRAWAWIVEQVGAEAAASALAALPGARKPYPSNVAKALGLSVPASVIEEPRRKPDMAALRAALKPKGDEQ